MVCDRDLAEASFEATTAIAVSEQGGRAAAGHRPNSTVEPRPGIFRGATSTRSI
jgi:hypothetical protein